MAALGPTSSGTSCRMVYITQTLDASVFSVTSTITITSAITCAFIAWHKFDWTVVAGGQGS